MYSPASQHTGKTATHRPYFMPPGRNGLPGSISR
jgi:hypothetical protein